MLPLPGADLRESFRAASPAPRRELYTVSAQTDVSSWHFRVKRSKPRRNGAFRRGLGSYVQPSASYRRDSRLVGARTDPSRQLRPRWRGGDRARRAPGRACDAGATAPSGRSPRRRPVRLRAARAARRCRVRPGGARAGRPAPAAGQRELERMASTALVELIRVEQRRHRLRLRQQPGARAAPPRLQHDRPQDVRRRGAVEDPCARSRDQTRLLAARRSIRSPPRGSANACSFSAPIVPHLRSGIVEQAPEAVA